VDDTTDDEDGPILPWAPPDEVEQRRVARLFIDHLLRNGTIASP
jgi:hypothetical protein